ncbi:Xaa-Pro aminopeptidase [Rhizobium petrolearium]|uniref:M24 family metallopeptidase n=1 Tax=Neorhizobium petrolearium TaxID=515361 RepID=UPI001AE3FC80|nr:Xaa-Pro peptidase family protein [Neorhizobium petrolearium]MBP1846585.1 Xaa-Pro aminopeptidase [Neorhizobium petrolearium]
MIGEIRKRRLIEAMEDAGLDGLVLYGNAWQNDYLRYAADFGILEGEGLAVVTRDGDVTLYLDDELEGERAAVECPEVKTSIANDLIGTVSDVVARLGNSRIAAGPKRHLPYGLAARRGDLCFEDATALLDRLLMVKSIDELNAVRSAARLADEGYAVFRNAAAVGKKDYELIAEIESFFRNEGVDDNFMIIGVGGPEVRGMAPPLGKVLKSGDLVTTELTPCVNGYYVQICRTLVVGEPNEAQRKVFGIYNDALEAGLAVVRPGVTAADIARAENDIFRAHGLGEYVTSEYTRVRGHGLGLFPDTKPHILEDVNTVIEEGMSLIVHPNTYNPEIGYFVHGDSLIVRADGPEILTTTPRQLFSVDARRVAA